MKKLSILFTLMACCLMACSGGQKKTTDMETGNETLVRLETTMGNITVKLYNENPQASGQFYQTGERGYLRQYALPPRNQEFYDSSWRPTEQDSYRYHYIR